MRALLVLAIVTAAAPAHADATDFVLPSGERVAGTRLRDLEPMAAQVERVRAAVKQALGVEIGGVPVHVLSIEDVRALHAEVGGRLPSGWQLHGFELDGHVFVRRGLGGVSDEVLVHECLHAASRRFADEAHARGLERVVEGVTQHLTLQALAARPRSAQLKAERNRTYVASTGFADAIATLVGEAGLREAYLRTGFAALAARVDAVARARGRLLEAARVLDRGDERLALEILTGARDGARDLR